MSQPPTLRYLLTSGYALIACCKDCRRFSDLDVLALSVRFGEDRPLSYLRPRLRCTECGHRGAELQIDSNRGQLPAARH